MNQDNIVKATKGIAIAAVAVVLVLVFLRIVAPADSIVPMMASDQYLSRGMGYSDSVGSGVTDASEMMPQAKSVAMMSPNKPTGMMAPPPIDITPSRTDEPTVQVEKKVIRTGNLSLRVDSADQAVSAVTRIAEGAGGSVASSNIHDGGSGIKSGTVTVRVPAATFTEVFGQLKQVARLVVSESITGQDVTEQAIDLSARIKNKQAEEEAYAKILQTQTQRVSDILEVTRALNTVRGEIESLQGQLKYLNSQADFSTITISLSEDPAVGQTATWRPWQVVKDAANQLIIRLQSLVDFFIQLVIIVLPVFLLYAFGIWIIWIIGRGVWRKVRG